LLDGSKKQQNNKNNCNNKIREITQRYVALAMNEFLFLADKGIIAYSFLPFAYCPFPNKSCLVFFSSSTAFCHSARA
jgi:hypothetical protein